MKRKELSIFMESAKETTGREELLLKHLGNVLHMLIDVNPDRRCAAYEQALEFYNRAKPNEMIEPERGFRTLYSHIGPLEAKMHNLEIDQLEEKYYKILDNHLLN